MGSLAVFEFSSQDHVLMVFAVQIPCCPSKHRLWSQSADTGAGTQLWQSLNTGRASRQKIGLTPLGSKDAHEITISLGGVWNIISEKNMLVVLVPERKRLGY